MAELQENSSIIHVPYDLHKLEVGALFEVPSGLDDAKPRLFRVISMQNRIQILIEVKNDLLGILDEVV